MEPGVICLDVYIGMGVLNVILEKMKFLKVFCNDIASDYVTKRFIKRSSYAGPLVSAIDYTNKNLKRKLFIYLFEREIVENKELSKSCENTYMKYKETVLKESMATWFIKQTTKDYCIKKLRSGFKTLF